MHISWNKLRNILLSGIGISFIFLGFLYSDNIMVGFSDFAFLSGASELKTLNLEITGGNTANFSIIIYNKEKISMDYRLGFVDAGITNDGFAQAACLGQNETEIFGKYITGDTSFFTLAAENSGTKTLSMTFPEYYSGIYHGCIMFFPTLTPLNTSPGGVSGMAMDAHTLPRRGGFVDVLVHSSASSVVVKAFSSNRIYQSTNNANTGILKIYDSNKTLIATSPLFTLNAAGTGKALINAPAGTYYMVFKGQSHLASYLSGVIFGGTGIDVLDFTTGTNLYGAQQLNSTQDDGYRYQSAGDLKNSLGVYDYMVNGNDIAILTEYGLQESGIDVLDPRNLNSDGAVNASDISVIGVNFEQTDPFKDGFFTWQ